MLTLFFESIPGSGIPGRMGIRSDLQSLYNLPLLDNEGGSRLISYLKKSFISVSGLALRLIHILVAILRFALSVLNLNLASPFLRSDGSLFVNVFRLCLLNGFDKGRDQCSNLSDIAPFRRNFPVSSILQR